MEYQKIAVPIGKTSSAYFAIKREALQEPERQCPVCGQQIHRRYYLSCRKYEDWNAFLKRKYCSRECANKALKGVEKPNTNYRKTSVEGLVVSRDGDFIYNHLRKTVTKPVDRKGKKQTARLIFNAGGRRYYQAARLVAEAWLPRYTPECSILFDDGDIHNIAADNLVLVTEEQFVKHRSRGLEGRKESDFSYQRKRIQNVIVEAQAVLHYFDTLDMCKVNEHVKEYLYGTLIKFAKDTLYIGSPTAEEIVTDAIGHLYEVLMRGHAVTHMEHYCKELLYRYKKRGSFGFMGQLPKEIQIQVQQLNLDCLCERYKVTSIRK